MYYPVSALLIEFFDSVCGRHAGLPTDTKSARPSKSSPTSKNQHSIPFLKKLEKNAYLTTYSQEFQDVNASILSPIPADNNCYLHEEWISYRDTIDGVELLKEDSKLTREKIYGKIENIFANFQTGLRRCN